MTRRWVIIFVVVAALAVPAGGSTQPAPKIPRVALLANATVPTGSPQIAAFRQALAHLGWIEGRAITFDVRWAEGNLERLPALAAELAATKPDVIVVAGPAAIRAAQRATRSIPVVFVSLTDPVADGLVASFARPGGNATGVASQYDELVTKQLQLLSEAVGALTRVAVLRHSDSRRELAQAVETAARSLGLERRVFDVDTAAQLATVFDAIQRDRTSAVHVLPSPFFNAHRKRLAELALRHRLPAIYEFSDYVKDGGLMSYGPSLPGMYARAASYVDRILRGARPGDLPIEQPERFELALNLKSASALGLTFPPAMLSRADHIVQ